LVCFWIHRLLEGGARRRMETIRLWWGTERWIPNPCLLELAAGCCTRWNTKWEWSRRPNPNFERLRRNYSVASGALAIVHDHSRSWGLMRRFDTKTPGECRLRRMKIRNELTKRRRKFRRPFAPLIGLVVVCYGACDLTAGVR
jgi:hypothetical protein